VLVRRSTGAFVALSALLAGTAAACDRCGGADTTKDAALGDARSAAAPEASTPSAEASGGIDATTAARDAAASLADAAPTDAGPSTCRLAYGPAEQPFRGPAAFVVSATELKLVANDGGKPRIYPVPLAPPPAASAPSVVPPAPASFASMRWPPCEVAGRWAYCQAPGGIVYRTTLGGQDTKQIAKSRPSTRIAAAALGADHSVVATLDVRRTTEGDRLQAFVTLDEGETVRLSEEGAGATVLRVVPRGAGAVALYLDSRTSMVPVHARPLSLRGSELALGEDAVVFVAGPPERAVDFTVAGTPTALFALLPIGRDTADFGVAAIPIAEHPKEDVQPVWSMYPNGLDPAAIAGTVQAEDGAWVARVRPAEREVGSLRVLELGRLDSAGAFRSLGAIASGKPITDVSIARDGFGSVWILYGDTRATWLERRVCP
jgi:hypothetical protein